MANYFHPDARDTHTHTCTLLLPCAHSHTRSRVPLNVACQTIFLTVTVRYLPLLPRSSIFPSFYLIPHRECLTSSLRRCYHQKDTGNCEGVGLGHFQYLLYFRPRRFHPLDIYRGVTLYAPRHYILIFQDSMIPSNSTSCAQLNR